MASWIRGSATRDPGPPTTGSGAGKQTGLAARRVPLYVWASTVFMLVIILAALLAPAVSPYDPIQQSLRERLRGPTWLPEEGRKRHLLGTDHLGRDILSRIIYGSRVSLVVGFAAVLIGGTIGGTLGVTSGYAGGAVDETSDIQTRLKARETVTVPRFCWQCRKPLHARSDRCPFCGEAQERR